MRHNLLLSIATLLLCSSACTDHREEPSTAIEVKQESYGLPGDQLFPEGIAYNPAKGILYVGSTTNGDVIGVFLPNGRIYTVSNYIFRCGLDISVLT